MNVTSGTPTTKFKSTYFTGTRILTAYDLFECPLSFDATNCNLSAVTIIRAGATFTVFLPTNSNISSIAYAKPSTTCTASGPASGGAVNIGAHKYAITYTIGSSLSVLSADSNIITTTAGNLTINLTNIPLGPTETISRSIYRTNAGGSTYYWIADIVDNTTTTYTDILADNTNILAPTTSTAYDITYITMPVLATGDIGFIVVNAPDPTYDLNQADQKTQEQSPAKIPVAGWQSAVISETNLAVNANPYYRPIPNNIQGGWHDVDIFIKATCATVGTTFQVYATSNTAPTQPADLAALSTLSVDWVNVTPQIFKNDPNYVSGSKWVLIPTTGTYQSLLNWTICDINGNKVVPDSFLIVMIISNAVNFIQVDISQR